MNLRDRLAKLEHQQWMYWTEYLMENHDLPEELEEKWEAKHIPYEELSEEEKDKDRKWGDKVLDELQEFVQGLEDPEPEKYRWVISSGTGEILQKLVEDVHDEAPTYQDKLNELYNHAAMSNRTKDSFRCPLVEEPHEVILQVKREGVWETVDGPRN